MDRKTLALLLTEAFLIVVLVVVLALDFNKPVIHHAAPDQAVTEDQAAEAEEPAKEEVKVQEEVAEAEEESAEEEPVAEVKEPEKVKQEKVEAPATVAAGGKTEVADVIPMENPAYDKHKKGIVQFTHKKHNIEYKLTCGQCHHNDKGEPLADLKMGDPVQGCIACHSKPGKAPKPKKGEKLTDEQKREYHTDALHDNCIGCHKDYNKKNNTKAAPASCGKCHPKNK